MEPEVEQSVDEHMIKYKGRSIMRQHIKNKPIKWGFRIWYRWAPNTGYLYEFDIYTGRKETAEFGLGKSVVLQLTEKLSGSFIRTFSWQFFHFVIAPKKIDWQLTVWDRSCSTNRKLLPKVEKPTKKKSQAEKKQKNQQKPKELVHGSSFTREESFNRG